MVKLSKRRRFAYRGKGGGLVLGVGLKIMYTGSHMRDGFGSEYIRAQLPIRVLGFECVIYLSNNLAARDTSFINVTKF